MRLLAVDPRVCRCAARTVIAISWIYYVLVQHWMELEPSCSNSLSLLPFHPTIVLLGCAALLNCSHLVQESVLSSITV
jgi:hypothetical protein